MELDKVIDGRRSIRKFNSKKVTKEQIKAILDAGNKAPSAKNKQHWRFYVYTGKAKKELTDFCLQEFEKVIDEPYVNPYAKHSFRIMEQAPVAILVFDEFVIDHPARPDIQSVSAAIQNMLLKAYDLGLGSLWICDVLYIDEQIKDYVKVDMPLLAAVSIGFTDEPERTIKKLSVDEVTTWL